MPYGPASRLTDTKRPICEYFWALRHRLRTPELLIFEDRPALKSAYFGQLPAAPYSYLGGVEFLTLKGFETVWESFQSVHGSVLKVKRPILGSFVPA